MSYMESHGHVHWSTGPSGGGADGGQASKEECSPVGRRARGVRWNVTPSLMPTGVERMVQAK